MTFDCAIKKIAHENSVKTSLMRDAKRNHLSIEQLVEFERENNKISCNSSSASSSSSAADDDDDDNDEVDNNKFNYVYHRYDDDVDDDNDERDVKEQPPEATRGNSGSGVAARMKNLFDDMKENKN